jgi:ribosomal protein S9
MNQKERRLVFIFLSELDELQPRLSKPLLKADPLTGDNKTEEQQNKGRNRAKSRIGG